MKFTTVLGLFASCTAVLAGPIYQRDLPSIFGAAANSTTTGSQWNSSNVSNHSNASNASNGTVPAETEPKLKVFITGGSYDLYQNQSVYTEVEFTTVFNTSSMLNLTQMYQLGSMVNQTLDSDDYYGVVLVSNAASVESLAFFSTVVFDTNKTVVVSEDVLSGLWVGTDPEAAGRGAVSVGCETGLIWSGVAATPVGIYSEDGVSWFLDASVPFIVGEDSFIRLYSNFTTVNSNSSSAPLVPIIYDGDYSPALISSLSSSLDGLVVVTSGSSNATSSSLASDTLPVVYAQAGPTLGWVPVGDIPDTAISAGYLTPIQAQILLSIAIMNNVTDPSDIMDLYP